VTLFNLLFFAIAALIVAATAVAITRRNLVHAVIYLVLGFFGSAFLFYLFGAPFLAALMVIVYAGAIMILFLFIIMMLRVEAPEERLFPPRQMAPAILFAAAYVVIGAFLLVQDPSAAVPLAEAQTAPSEFGRYVYTNSWLAVEIASLMLLVAMIGALLVGKRPAQEDGE
jgi:NADH-quinone oxidoreductase subunit J